MKNPHSCRQSPEPRLKWPLIVLRMLRAYPRQILWRLEFNRDVLLNLDRPFVQESGLETPQANGVHRSRKKKGRAAYKLYIQHLAKLPDRGADLDGFCRSMSIPRLGITRPNEEDKLTSLQSYCFMSRCRSGLRRDKNRKFRGHRERRGGGNRFFRESHPKRFAAIGWGSDKDGGGR